MSKSGQQSVETSSHLADVPDDELDAYIADLIVQKSRAKASSTIPKHEELLIAGPSKPQVPNTNKRFLASVIQNVEGHNQALLRQQAREAERTACRNADATAQAKENLSAPSKPKGENFKLRGWSDDEEDTPRSTYRSHARSVSYGEKSRQRSESPQLSSKMDKYFDESASEGERPNSKHHAGTHREGGHDERHRRRRHHSSSHDRDRERIAPSKHSSHREHKDGSDESRRRSSDKEGSRRHRRRDDDDRKREGRDGERSKRRREEDRTEHSSSRRRKEESSSSRRDSHDRSERRAHKNQEERSKEQAVASLEQAQPRKIREWDLGKDSLAF